MTQFNPNQIRSAANGVRRRVLDHVIKNNGGYLSQACSSAEILSSLYLGIMNIGPSQAPMVPLPFTDVPGRHNPDYQTGAVYNGLKKPHLDRFIFSPSHYALVLYATLVEIGRMAPEGLLQFNQDGSTVEMIGAEHSPGVETTTGSLGQALSQAGGIALARKIKKESGRVFVFMTDGELQEGQTWEAFSALAFHKLDNVIIYFDMNRQQCDGAMDTVMEMGSVYDRLSAFGASVHEVDGHDPEALRTPLEGNHTGKPLVILANTDTCRGIDALRRRAPKLHYVRFAGEGDKKELEEVLSSWKS